MAKNNINDGKRFTDIRSLADVLNTTIEDATQIAIDAKAVMRIGQKTWYDWDKCLEYAKAKAKPKITFDSVNWVIKSTGNNLKYDVRVTNGDKTGRTRISINQCALTGFKFSDYANVGVSGDFLVFDLAAEKGFKCDTTHGNTVYAFNVKDKAVAVFEGAYSIHRLGDLFYIDIKEKQ